MEENVEEINERVEQEENDVNYAVEVTDNELKGRIKPFELPLKTAIYKICCLVCIAYPLLVIFLSAVLSVPLTYFAEWPAEESFFELMVELSNANADSVLSEDLGRNAALTRTGVSFLIVMLAGFISMGLFGCLLGIFSGGPMDFPIVKKALELLNIIISSEKQVPSIAEILDKKNTKEDKEDLIRNDYDLYGDHIYPSRGEKYDDFIIFHSSMLCGFCCIIFPLIALFISLFFGGILAFAEEEWQFVDGYYTVFQELLSLEVKLVNPPPATNFGAKMIVCLVAIWSSGFFFVILGLLSGPALIPYVKHIESESERFRTSMDSSSKTRLFKEVCFSSCVVIPLLIFAFSIVFGVCLAIISPFTLGESISEAMAEITNMQSDIRDLDPSQIKGFTRFFLIVIGLFGLAFFALTLGFFSYFFTARIAVALNFVPDYSKKHLVRDSLKRIVLFVTVGIPLIAILLSLVFGSILSAAESAIEGDTDLAGEVKWNFKVGFFVVLSELLDINVEIYDIPQTEHPIGKIILALIGSFSYSFFTLALAVIGGPVVVPIVHYFAGTAYKVAKEEEEVEA